jgi:3-dehydroquinate synthase
MKDKLIINTQQHTYEIIYSNNFINLADCLNKFNIANRKVCIVTDTNVAKLYLEEVKNILSSVSKSVCEFVFDAGEHSKTLNTVSSLYSYLIENKFERSDLLIALGGGVVGDLTGFAAATYLRGIDFVQVPTTLLAQVDSSVGGKTGVDFESYKNMIGAFYQPILVYMNISSLLSLPTEVYLSGFGEIVKHAIIRDESLFRRLVTNISKIENKDVDFLMQLVYTNCDIKRSVVELDAKENSLRAILNFGHTIGHSVEKLCDFKLLHGECVAIGTIAATFISYKRGYIDLADLESVINLTKAIGLPIKVDNLDIANVLAVTQSDKKNKDGKLHFILIDKIGNAIIKTDITESELLEAISYILE